MGSLYSEYTSWLHAWSAGRKLLLMALLGTGLFLIHSPWLLALAGAACGLLWLSLGRATEGARRLMLSVTVAALLVAAFHVWMQHYALAAASALRLVCASTLGMALTVSTRPSDLVDVLERLLAPLERIGISRTGGPAAGIDAAFHRAFLCAVEAHGRCPPAAHGPRRRPAPDCAADHPHAAGHAPRVRRAVGAPGPLRPALPHFPTDPYARALREPSENRP